VGADQAFALLEAIQRPTLAHRGGPILFANGALQSLLSRRREDLEGAPFHTLAHPDFQEVVRRHGAARLSGGDAPQTYECRLQAAGADSSCWVEVTASIARIDGIPTIIASFYDLTERRHAAAREERWRQLLAQIIDGDPVPTFVINAEHTVTHWNRACAAVTGVQAREVVGTNRQWAAFYPAERPVMADLIVSNAVESRYEALYGKRFRRSAVIDGAFEGENFFPAFGNTGRWLYFTAAPLRDCHGAIIGAIETLQDVTARREAEARLRQHQLELEDLVETRTAQLQQANQQLLQSEKLASIGQLAAGVAHEINNPIGYVHSNIGALEGYIDDLFAMLDLYQRAERSSAFPDLSAALKEKREAIDLDFLREDIPMLMRESREGINRVKKIVQDLKDFSHVDRSNEWQWASVHAGIESTLNVVRNEVKYKADVVKEFGDLPDIQCLPSQLNQVFVNLLVNSAHAMGEQRGQITIRTGNKGDSVWLEFSDTGSGIPEEIQNRIFDPFFTTKPVGKGTGLGLSLSYGIIQRHNGSITVRSRPGEGTVFRIVLPVSHAERNTSQ